MSKSDGRASNGGARRGAGRLRQSYTLSDGAARYLRAIKQNAETIVQQHAQLRYAGRGVIEVLTAALEEIYPDRVIPRPHDGRQAVRSVALLMGYREARPDELRNFPHEDLGPGGPAQLFVSPDGEFVAGYFDWYSRCVHWRHAAEYTEETPFTGPELDV